MNLRSFAIFVGLVLVAPLASLGRASATSTPRALSTSRAKAPTNDERVFIELSASREKYFVGEPIHVRIRFGVDAEFARTNLVQLFQKPLDVPVQIEAPWIEGFANASPAVSIASTSSLERRASFALAERPAFARRLEDRVVTGRPFAVLEYEATLAASASGALSIPATELRYAYATRFDEDFAKGRVALDRRDESVLSAPLVLTVVALPEQDRPPDFGGAVGAFTISAELPSFDVEMGASLALRVHIEGEGNLASFDAPHADRLPGFHVRGVLDDKSTPRRTITYDLTPNDERVDTVPPLRFTYFDPTEPARYKTIETKALPIRVHASTTLHADETATNANAATSPTQHEMTDAAQRAPNRESKSPTSVSTAETRGSPSILFLWTGLVAIALFAGFWVIRSLLRRATARTDDSRALSELRARLRESESGVTAVDVADAFAAYIATRLGSSTAAVIAPDLEARLRAHVAPELATRTARMLETLVAARYGGPRVEHASSEIEKLALELERQFERAR